MAHSLVHIYMAAEREGTRCLDKDIKLSGPSDNTSIFKVYPYSIVRFGTIKPRP